MYRFALLGHRNVDNAANAPSRGLPYNHDMPHIEVPFKKLSRKKKPRHYRVKPKLYSKYMALNAPQYPDIVIIKIINIYQVIYSFSDKVYQGSLRVNQRLTFTKNLPCARLACAAGVEVSHFQYENPCSERQVSTHILQICPFQPKSFDWRLRDVLILPHRWHSSL